MRTDPNVLRGLCRGVLQLALVAGGVVVIWGSGGGIGGLPDWEGPGYVGPYPTLQVEPTRATASVGGGVVFSARATNAGEASYQWCRAPGGGGACVDIPGATGEAYTVAGVNLADDGARYVVKLATGRDSLAASAYLRVSSMPGVVYQDGEFLPSDWSVAAIVSPSPDGPAYTVTRSATGGNPGAFVSVNYGPFSGLGSVRVLHGALSATYDPATQGAIYTIDFTEDCIGSAGAGAYPPYTAPFLAQAGRRYGVGWQDARVCSSSDWAPVVVRRSLVQSDFELIDGPACGAGESCPDFSAAGAPITLGLISAVDGGLSAGTRAHGFDNWKVTVWRR